MLSVSREQGQYLPPPRSDDPWLEVVRLLAADTEAVTEVVIALRTCQLPLVSPEVFIR